uniref:CPG4 domain-containing protein n=1 Tax=Parastrongyloides trichosuri TaxID=131310 RepID=A0A0N4ZNN6_PARTI
MPDLTSCLIDVKQGNIPLNDSIFNVITNATTEAKLLRLCKMYEKTKGCFQEKIYTCASQEQVSYYEKIERLYKFLCSPTSLPFQKMLYKYGNCLRYSIDNFNENNCNKTISSIKIQKCELNCAQSDNNCQEKIEESKIRTCEHDSVIEQCGSQATKFFDLLKSTEFNEEYPVSCYYKNITGDVSYKDMINKKKNNIVNKRISNSIHETFKSLKTTIPITSNVTTSITTTTGRITTILLENITTTINPILTMNPYHGAYVPFQNDFSNEEKTTKEPHLTTTVKINFPNFINPQQQYESLLTSSTQLKPFNFSFKFNPSLNSSNDQIKTTIYTTVNIENTTQNPTTNLTLQNDMKHFKETANTYVSTALDVIADKTQDIVKNAVIREVFATILRLSPEIFNETSC